jgi:hypothetical protein
MAESSKLLIMAWSFLEPASKGTQGERVASLEQKTLPSHRIVQWIRSSVAGIEAETREIER